VIRRGAHPLAWSLLLATLLAGAACGPGEPLRIPTADAAVTADAPDPADGGATADATTEACPAKVPAPSGANEPGDFCTGPSDCRRAVDEIVTCWPRHRNDEQLKLQRCHRFTHSRLGESCELTGLTGSLLPGRILVGQYLPDVAGYCDFAQGLVCDSVERRCRTLPQLGQSCAGTPYCAPGRAVGEVCQGYGDFDYLPECELSAHCDIALNRCVPRVAPGRPCDYDPQCTSGACRDGTCAPAGTCPL
jgi:predicted small lipoprotein YifL